MLGFCSFKPHNDSILSKIGRVLCCLVLVALVGCGTTRPDLASLYGSRQKLQYGPETTHPERQLPPPVVVIHGIMGGKLRYRSGEQAGSEIWPGSLLNLLWSDYRGLTLPFDPETLAVQDDQVEAFAITDKVAGVDFYQRLLQVLELHGQYQRAVPGQAVDTGVRNYYVFYYDWRQDNVQSARRLARFLAQIRADYQNPDQQVDIVAHSMGGLVARYFLRYGEEDVLNDNRLQVTMAGAPYIRKLILLGTPNLGSLEIFTSFVRGKPIGLTRVQPEVLATFPSTYQLFPHPVRPWMYTPSGTPLERDIFDYDLWQRFEWSVFSPEVKARLRQQFDSDAAFNAYHEALGRLFQRQLERGRRFVWSLTVAPPEGLTPFPLVVFGGDCEQTPSRVVVENRGDDSLLRISPGEISEPDEGLDYERFFYEPGDGSVTKPSLLALQALDRSIPRHRWVNVNVHHSIMLCENHASLTGNINFQNNLLNELLSPDRLSSTSRF